MRRLAILLVSTTLVAAACGDSDDDPAARSGEPETTSIAEGEGATIELAAKSISFDRTELTAAAGRVTITFDNQDHGIMHNLHVTGSGLDGRTEIETGPATQTLEVELDPGTYSYVCDVHPQQMKGELEVT